MVSVQVDGAAQQPWPHRRQGAASAVQEEGFIMGPVGSLSLGATADR